MVHKQKLAELSQSLAALKADMLKKDGADFTVNYQIEPLGESIEKLVTKNDSVNKKQAEIRSLNENLEYGFRNRVFYKISEGANSLYDEMSKVLTTMALRFFKKFKLLLVRPKFESAFNEQLDMLKEKLNQELLPKLTKSETSLPVDKTATLRANTSMSNESEFSL